jgi:hypothetical protein
LGQLIFRYSKKAPLASTTTLDRLITEKTEDAVLHALKLEAGSSTKEDKKCEKNFSNPAIFN